MARRLLQQRPKPGAAAVLAACEAERRAAAAAGRATREDWAEALRRPDPLDKAPPRVRGVGRKRWLWWWWWLWWSVVVVVVVVVIGENEV